MEIKRRFCWEMFFGMFICNVYYYKGFGNKDEVIYYIVKDF